MAIINSLQKTVAGYGSGPVTASKTGITNAINTTTTTTFSNANLGNPVSLMAGKFRVKTQNTIALTYPGTGSGQVTAIKVAVSDGTNSVIIANIPTFAANDLFDLTFDFINDIDTVQSPLISPTVTVAVTVANVANGQAVLDYEICYNL